jgi:ribose 5-phosphate isomerase B
MIYLASDHAGLELKKSIFEHLKEMDMEVEDCGPHAFDPQDDYPDFIYPCAVKVAQNPGSMGIILGMSGNGEAIVANKVKGIRAAHYYGGHEEIISLARQHNNANILSFGAKFMTAAEVERAVDLFIETGFDGGRHQRRIDKIDKIEQN